MLIRCPACRKEVAWEQSPSRPFCSERCRLVDLGAWIDEEYRIPAEERDPEENLGTEST